MFRSLMAFAGLAAVGLASFAHAQEVVDDAGSDRGGKVGSWPSVTTAGGDLAASYFCEQDNDQGTGDRYALRFAWRDGTGWHRHTVNSGTGGSWSQLARASDGTYHMVWYAAQSLKWATGSGSSWTIAPGRVDNSLVYPVQVSLVLDDADRPHVVYANGEGDGDGSLRYTYWNGTAWVHGASSIIATGVYAGASAGGDYLALDSAGVAHVAYVQPVNGVLPGQIHLRRLVGGVWQDELIGAAAYDVKLVLDADDVAHLVYSNPAPGGLSYATNASGGWTHESVYTESWASALALDLDPAGEPVASFRATSAGLDAVVTCSKQDGAWVRAVVESVGGGQLVAGIGTDVAVDDAGIPHVVYGKMWHDGTGWFIQDFMAGVPQGSCIVIDEEPASVVSCPAGPASFTVGASGPGSLGYQWQASESGGAWTDLAEGLNELDGGDINAAGAATPTLTLTGFRVGDDPINPLFPMRVRAVVSADCGTTSSAPADLGVCPGDFDCSGAVNTLDVLAFLNAWSAGGDEGDFNADGTVNTLDVLQFLNAWSGGC